MKKERVELKINIAEAGCVTDCWIFTRLAILRTSEYYEDWVASHYPLYADPDSNFFFGETSTIHPAYHDAILERRQINLYTMGENEVVEKAKEILAEGYYLVMTVKIPNAVDFYHELLLYGFDDEKECFLTADVQNRLFQPVIYDYSYIRDSFSEVKQHYKENKYMGLGNSVYYQYPLTAMRLKKNYNPEGCPFEAYLKLDDEWNGVCHRKGSLQDMKERNETGIIYRGINCLYALKNMLSREIAGELFPTSFRGLSSAAKKISEHQKFILISMRYLRQKWGAVMNERAEFCIREYENCCRTVEKWSNMVLKYEYTRDIELLQRIVPEIAELYEQEYESLDLFLHKSIEWVEFNQRFI